MDISPTQLDRPNGTILSVMLSSDLLPNVLAFVTPATSTRHQTWLASLALVHRSWRGPVSFALRQHPILTSLSRLLQFQDSLWDSGNAVSSIDRHRRFPDHFEPLLPLASPIESLILDFKPSALSYLLEILSPSLSTIGLHDVQFSSQLSQSELSSFVFDLIFSVPRLTTLNLSGSLAGISGIWAVLGIHPPLPSTARPDRTVSPALHEKTSNLNERSKLRHIILADGICSNFSHISPLRPSSGPTSCGRQRLIRTSLHAAGNHDERFHTT
ncbi:uncharacterized protein MELLADRAFT_106199 [Melampsora larici-populina 98AG31]|uniref:Uncharacterized protein n=1 Tax=Melampsora larici-populina (strain 98AG31 / pathotype 3-4-7) TaxID=747676 RepID=F4RLE1_MELLP|nr:uncharacterized protein MELLADRAFT_106199 [Melampsora larici-populina 98AG31]EGG07013.1 hypothetical protein MELLADRAFT_106199 [Melampsora larici-populina 98AG31]